MLQFDADSHTYRVDGTVVPSVTQVLEPLSQLKGVSPAILERAREFGTHVHLACHLFDIGRLDLPDLDPALDPYLRGWIRFLGATNFAVMSSEQPMHHSLYGYCGTPDKVGSYRNQSCVIDIKTGAVPFTVGPQTAAYQRMIEPMPKRRLCVQLLPNDFRVHELKDPMDFSVFQSALNIHKFMRGKKADYGQFIDP